ncbi:MAG: hypothetical protein AXA67_10770 [Methylothermaceae bacteria B42]|nr:MAG: hypothetical protein AXA67_10770 [Methylothermaceae bacteria B42]HHJ38959.1 VanZ family protein [Methylothermaceae bacterium]
MTFLSHPWWTGALRVCLGVYLLFILYLSLAPQPLEEVEINDKFGHLIAFFGLGLLTDLAFPKHKFGWLVMLNLFAIGVLIEAMQYHTQYRTASIADLIADALGLLGYWLTRHWLIKQKN